MSRPRPERELPPVARAYEQVASDLTAAIQRGDYQPGDVLPTVRDLAGRYDVSINTVNGAIEDLQRKGLVYAGYFNGKRGVRVRNTRRAPYYATDALRRDGDGDVFVRNAKKAGRVPAKRFTMLMRVPPAGVADRLGIPPSTLTVERTTVQLLDGEPWSRERSWYPLDLAQETGLDTPEDITEGAIKRLAAKGFHETAHRDEITDVVASEDDAADLAVRVGASLVLQTRTAATNERVTRVTRYIRLGGRNRLIWETGSDAGLDVIRDVFSDFNGDTK